MSEASEPAAETHEDQGTAGEGNAGEAADANMQLDPEMQELDKMANRSLKILEKIVNADKVQEPKKKKKPRLGKLRRERIKRQEERQSEANKRQRSDPNSPEDQPPLKKNGPPSIQNTKLGQGNEPGPSYRDQTIKNFHLLIVTKDDPRRALSEKELNLLSTALKELVFGAVGEGVRPHFEGTVSRDGRFLVRCSDQFTFDWLKESVLGGKMKPWPEADIAAMHPSEVDGCIAMRAWITTPRGWDATRILWMLKQQNDSPSLRTDRWILHSCTWKGDGWVLMVSVNEESYASMEQLRFRPYFLDHRVFFKKIGGSD